jgi:hypothetical protein
MSADPKPTIEELDAILSQARDAWLSAKTPAAERKARSQINELLDIRISLMDDRDFAPITELQLQ